MRYRDHVQLRWVTLAVVLGLVAPSSARARPQGGAPPAPPLLTDLVVPPGDDARRAIAIGPRGEVYAPDGKRAWVRERAVTVAGTVSVVGRANGVVALANGAVYRLADNGWSALRLVQKGTAVMSSGARAVAAVGRQLFALDRLVGGEVAKLAMAPTPVQLIGAGARALTIQTERGLFRADAPGAAWKPIARAPRRVDRLIDDRWALTDRGPVDLKTGTVTAWPAGFRVGAVTPGAKGTLVVVGTAQRGAIEVVVIDGVKVTRDTITGAATPDSAKAAPTTAHTAAKAAPTTATNTAPPAPEARTSDRGAPAARTDAPDGPLVHPVGVVADTSGRVVVAFRDGRLAVRDRGTWSLTAVIEALPAPRPGAAPARSP